MTFSSANLINAAQAALDALYEKWEQLSEEAGE